MTWRHFTDEEVAGLNLALVEMLDEARDKAHTPFIITSGLRSASENNSLPNAVSDSSHLRGLGVDLMCSQNIERFLIVSNLIKVGFRRIGVYPRHIHVDCDPDLPQGVFWLGKYDSKESL